MTKFSLILVNPVLLIGIIGRCVLYLECGLFFLLLLLVNINFQITLSKKSPLVKLKTNKNQKVNGKFSD